MIHDIPRSDPEPPRRLFVLLAVIAFSLVSSRLMHIVASTGETPMLSANDRSRWCAVRALVDQGTFEIDSVIRERNKKSKRKAWNTIDRVRHRGWDGREHDYSSKPPLLPTIFAGEYWVLKKVTGVSLRTHSFFLIRVMLWVSNGGLLLLWWWLVARSLFALSGSWWTRGQLFAMAGFGTFLTTFAVTLNNHLPAAVCCALTVDALLSLARGGRQHRYYWQAGFGAAMTAANELPALSLLVAVGAYLMWRDPRRALTGFLPAALLVAAAFFGTNYWAHGSWRPPYAHRSDGREVAEIAGQPKSHLQAGDLSSALRAELEQAGIKTSERAVLEPTGKANRWALWDPKTEQRWALTEADGKLVVREWDDWYDYEGSYWRKENRKGVDRGEPSRAVYSFHVLLGHHGIFSLTPFWIFSVAGIAMWLRSGTSTQKSLALLTLALSVVCIAFFLKRPLVDRNYGGVTTGFRWLFWLIPLWLITTFPAVERLSGSKFGRGLVYLFLAVSVFSATYGAAQPWSHPWLYNYWHSLGWL